MKFENAVVPNQEQIAGFMEPGHDQPIYMVNLLKFKDKAAYADGRSTDLTGEEAYGLYPSRRSMLQMMQLPKMQEIGEHRAAGLAGQLNIETVAPAGRWLDATD